MDSGRIFRALVMFLTLLGVLWAIRQISSMRHPVATPAAKTAVQTPLAIPEAEVHSLPFVAIDNTCRSDHVVDLASCTGLSTKGTGTEYRFELSSPASISIEVKPEYELFDAGFAVLDEHENCVIGREQNPAGMTESALLKMLPAGRYRLVVGGYNGDCGPLTLTVGPARALVADLTKREVVYGPNGISLKWRTFGENEIEYFEIVRAQGDTSAVAARVRGRGGPARAEEYKYLDRVPGGAVYSLIAVSRDGRREELGPLG